jgi:glycosyltransferase involved in cell wall biosynthesis
MKILKVTGGYPPAFAQGGTATAAHSLMKALKRQGADVAVLTLNINGKERLEPSNGFVDYEGIPVWYCRGAMLPVPYYSQEFSKVLSEQIKDNDIVLLDSNWTGYGIWAGKICRGNKKPYIIYSHGCLDPSRLKISRFKKNLWWRFFDASLYNNANAVIALTKAEVDHLRNKDVRTPITVIPNGVEQDPDKEKACVEKLTEIRPELAPGQYFLFLGRLDPIKGIDLLMKAYASLFHQIQDPLPRLVIAGPSHKDYMDQLRTLQKDLRLGDKVLFTGLVRGTGKWSLLKYAKAFILPSLGEGLPMTALEALSIGTPVILSKSCYLPEVSEWTAGLEVEPRVDSIEEALKWIIENPEEHKKMAQKGIEMVEKVFTWEKVAQKTLDICRRVLKERTA